MRDEGREGRGTRARAARKAATGAGSTTGGVHLSLGSPPCSAADAAELIEHALLSSPSHCRPRNPRNPSARTHLVVPRHRTHARRRRRRGAGSNASPLGGRHPPVCVSCGDSGSRSRRRTVLLHGLEELHHHLRARAHEHLALSALLRVVDGLERIRECSHASHDELREGGGGGGEGEGGQ